MTETRGALTAVQTTITGERADLEARHRARVARFEKWYRETVAKWKREGLIP